MRLSPEQIKKIQQRLGMADHTGIVDELTVSSIRKFQDSKGLKVTGDLDTKTVRLLKINGVGITSEPTPESLVLNRMHLLTSTMYPNRTRRPTRLTITDCGLTPFEAAVYWERRLSWETAYQYIIHDGSIYEMLPEEKWSYHNLYDSSPQANEQSICVGISGNRYDGNQATALTMLCRHFQHKYEFDIWGVDRLAHENLLRLDTFIPQLKNNAYSGIFTMENFNNTGINNRPASPEELPTWHDLYEGTLRSIYEARVDIHQKQTEGKNRYIPSSSPSLNISNRG